MLLFKAKDKKHRSYRERGQILVEFALVATVFFTFIFGIFDMARLFQSWMTVQHAAREGARYAITGQVSCDGITADRSACITQAAKSATTGISRGGVSSSIVQVTYEYWDYHTGYADPATSGAGGPCDTIEVEVKYQHSLITPLVKPVFGLLGKDPVTITGTQRMTNEPWGDCNVNTLPTPVPTVAGGGSNPGGGTATPTPPAPTATFTPTFTPTATNTPTNTPTRTPTPTNTPTRTPTPGPPTATPTRTPTPRPPTATPTRTPTPIPPTATPQENCRWILWWYVCF